MSNVTISRVSRETLVTALAHHTAFFTVMSALTCDAETAQEHLDTAMDLWLEEYGFHDKLADNELSMDATRLAMAIVGDAIRRSGQGHLGRRILEMAEEAGVGSFQFIQRVLH